MKFGWRTTTNGSTYTHFFLANFKDDVFISSIDRWSYFTSILSRNFQRHFISLFFYSLPIKNYSVCTFTGITSYLNHIRYNWRLWSLTGYILSGQLLYYQHIFFFHVNIFAFFFYNFNSFLGFFSPTASSGYFVDCYKTETEERERAKGVNQI